MCGLKQQYHSCVGDILLVDEVKRKDTEASGTDGIFAEDINHSLTTQMRYAYIDFPQNVNLRVNNTQVFAQNPFGDILQFVAQDEDVAIRGESKDFRYWIISEPKLKSLGVSDEILSKFEGLLIYKGNEFVKTDEAC